MEDITLVGVLCKEEIVSTDRSECKRVVEGEGMDTLSLCSNREVNKALAEGT